METYNNNYEDKGVTTYDSDWGMHSSVKYVCMLGHICYDIPRPMGVPAYIPENTMRTPHKCDICTIQAHLHGRDQQAQLTTMVYTDGDVNFEAICMHEHRFIVSKTTARYGCRTCKLLQNSPHLYVYKRCLNMHDGSPLRLHCRRQVHNPACEDPQCRQLLRGKTAAVRNSTPNCSNYITCNKVFYATPKQVKYSKTILQCVDGHILPSPHCCWVLAKRSFEVLFDTTFDDTLFGTGLEFTGLNRSVGIAFTHLLDKNPSKCIEDAAKWCNDNNVRFITVPATACTASAIDRSIVHSLSTLGLLHMHENRVFECLRTTIKAMKRSGQLFPVRS